MSSGVKEAIQLILQQSSQSGSRHDDDDDDDHRQSLLLAALQTLDTVAGLGPITARELGRGGKLLASVLQIMKTSFRQAEVQIACMQVIISITVDDDGQNSEWMGGHGACHLVCKALRGWSTENAKLAGVACFALTNLAVGNDKNKTRLRTAGKRKEPRFNQSTCTSPSDRVVIHSYIPYRCQYPHLQLDA